MPVDWFAGQRDAVAVLLDAHPAESGRCLEAARGVLPIAQKRDGDARPFKLVPLEGRFVVPRLSVGRRWFHHYAVEVVAHCVDALTGPDGSSRSDYLDRHWQYGDRIGWNHVELERETI